MKKHVRKMVSFVLILALVMSSVYFSDVVEAYGDIKDGWEYEVINGEDGETIQITGYIGEDKDIVIPDSIEGLKVTSVGWSAFSNCTGLGSITIPEGVTSIGDGAFYSCTGLKSIVVDKENKIYDSRSNCNAIILTSENELIAGCQNTKIPEDVTSIGNNAFSGCTGLESITIPEGVTSIGWGAFSGCTGLESITIPEGVTSISNDAFSGCTSLKSIVVDKENKKYDSRNNCNAIILTSRNKLITGCQSTTIPEGVTSIGYGAFSGCTGLESITIPEDVTSIDSYAFSGCTGLEGITIPEGVTSIGRNAFSGCTGLGSITIPEGVTSIGLHAFSSCTGLGNITIPEGVTSIGDCAFLGCTSLKSIVVDKENKKYDSRSNCNAIILTSENKLIAGCQNTTIPEGVASIGDDAFSGCTGLGSIMIPEGVTSIGWGAFYGCTGLESITIPEGVTSIGYSAFAGCTGLGSITIPKCVASIGNYAFSGCTGLESITIPEGVTSIGWLAFSDCTGLGSITIPEGMTSISYGAFSGCTGLGSITIPEGVTSIDDNAFSGCTGLGSITILEGVTSIGRSAFSGCTGLGSITIPSSVTNIKEYAFGYVWNTSYYKMEKIPDFIIYGTSGSEAERYAKDNGFTFRLSSEGSQSQEDKIICKKTAYKVAYGTKPFKINATSNSRMTFTSSKPNVATVDKNTGNVTIKNTGVANITIKAGKATKKVTIKVSPKKPSVKSAKAAKGRKLTIKWANDKMASGYQVQISTDKTFKKNVKSKNLSKTSYTFTKLETGKKYYVRVCSYKKSGKETLYSAWSKAKLSDKVKK